MPFDEPIKLALDRERLLRWTMRAEARLGRLEHPPALADLLASNHRRAFYALCAWVWAALDDPLGDFAAPEDLAELLKEPETQAAAGRALLAALRQAGVLKPEKKTDQPTSAGEPKPAPAAGSASHGPTRSSSSARPPRGMRT